jgi:hypothetical protein
VTQSGVDFNPSVVPNMGYQSALLFRYRHDWDQLLLTEIVLDAEYPCQIMHLEKE